MLVISDGVPLKVTLQRVLMNTKKNLENFLVFLLFQIFLFLANLKVEINWFILDLYCFFIKEMTIYIKRI